MPDLLDQLVERIADAVAAKLAAPLKAADDTNLVSTLEAASRLDVHPDTMRRWAKAGCPADHIGKGRLRFDLAKVREWLATRA